MEALGNIKFGCQMLVFPVNVNLINKNSPESLTVNVSVI